MNRSSRCSGWPSDGFIMGGQSKQHDNSAKRCVLRMLSRLGRRKFLLTYVTCLYSGAGNYSFGILTKNQKGFSSNQRESQSVHGCLGSLLYYWPAIKCENYSLSCGGNGRLAFGIRILQWSETNKFSTTLGKNSVTPGHLWGARRMGASVTVCKRSPFTEIQSAKRTPLLPNSSSERGQGASQSNLSLRLSQCFLPKWSYSSNTTLILVCLTHLRMASHHLFRSIAIMLVIRQQILSSELFTIQCRYL